ncbi:ABC transporter ATP-binding protein [Parachlamydia acanthamoebae]|jgi:ABC-type multidrug transport system fused ATPase/permease subunit|uniref:Lipid A export ATP-binding/permease protein MsbA n=3 Tax=Parachlamydia acanthamoebae TaxID=83552 RepID=F8KZD2_PARAV|nr:ABC transporter ATP-binding protein [Parachlamydia acanthamoebae]CCB86272.1 lipid A export ATP-binding/permease protein MsbA [Parachlamydia acanthamoebae UV-7]
MRYLFKAALTNRKHLFLIIFTMVSMCLVTIASQLEMFALGVITKGPAGIEFFELFAPVQNGHLSVNDEVSFEQVRDRWHELSPSDEGVTRQVAEDFIQQHKKKDLISSVLGRLNQIFPISKNLTNLAYFLVVVALFKASTLFAYRFSTRILAIRVSRDLRQQYFEHIQSLPMSFYQQYNSGSLSSRVVGDAAQIAEALNACLVNYVHTPFTIVTSLFLCFYASWKLSLIVFLGLPLVVIPIGYIAKQVKRISKQIQQNQERFASVLIDFLAGVQTVKMFAMENFSLSKYRDLNDRMATLEQRSAKYDLSSRPVMHTIAMFFLAITLLYGLYFLKMSVSEIIVYCGLLYLFYEPIKKFAEENSHIQRGLAAAERMLEVMNIKPHIEDQEHSKDFSEFKDKIEFDNVSFRYGESWILKDLSFTIRKGEFVAIVGPTGAGKSTIVQLLPRLYDPQKGEIRIDGQPLNAYTQRSLREMIAFVPQRSFLFLDTISSNIAFGRGFSTDQIEEAAKKAHAHDFICQLPEGYKTELCEAGKNLSGGQQQRLAIARALVKSAPILVMDEATSSLDMMSEFHIKQAIHRLRGQMTQIIIAHRLSTIEDADRIIYLEKGQKIAEGTKEELLQSCEGFRVLWQMMHRQSTAQASNPLEVQP